MTFELSDDEAALLREVIEADVRDLRMEIADTDNPSFKHGLRGKEAVLTSLLERLGGRLA